MNRVRNRAVGSDGRSNKPKPAWHQVAVELFKAGKNYAEIGALLHRNPERVRVMLMQHHPELVEARSAAKLIAAGITAKYDEDEYSCEDKSQSVAQYYVASACDKHLEDLRRVYSFGIPKLLIVQPISAVQP